MDNLRKNIKKILSENTSNRWDIEPYYLPSFFEKYGEELKDFLINVLGIDFNDYSMIYWHPSWKFQLDLIPKSSTGSYFERISIFNFQGFNFENSGGEAPIYGTMITGEKYDYDEDVFTIIDKQETSDYVVYTFDKKHFQNPPLRKMYVPKNMNRIGILVKA